MQNFLPPIGLLNKYHIGDSVLLEPIGTMLSETMGVDVSIISQYPELFDGHPTLKGIDIRGEMPQNMRLIDMKEALCPVEKVKGKKKLLLKPEKIKRMYKAAGLPTNGFQQPRLYLTDEEKVIAATLERWFPPNRVGIAWESRYLYKNWPYMAPLIESLVKNGITPFIFAANPTYKLDALAKSPAIKIINKSLREAMVYISIMDKFVGPDTGLLHIAGALGIPIVPIVRKCWEDHYAIYNDVEIHSTNNMSKLGLWSISPRKVMKSLVSQTPKPKKRKVRRSKEDIGLFRLDGLGGTITLADQAKKIYEQTGLKSVPIVRGHKDVFANNPYISDVVEVGYVDWGKCLAQIKEEFDTIAEIRLGPAKWHQGKTELFQQDFNEETQEFFDAFPLGYNVLEKHGLHHVQITDQYLGLPPDTIEIEAYEYSPCKARLPREYLVVTDGVDVQHKGLRQTKTWDGWGQLVSLIDIPFVQVGTMHDLLIPGAIDLRGKTEIGELFTILRDAEAVVCTEGGIMHLAFAVKATKVVILRGPTRSVVFEYPGHHFVDSYVCDNCWWTTEDWFAVCPRHIDAVCMKSITAERVAFNLEEVLS